ncbi:alpha/beta hydrolase [Myxococcus qinghaiensis]|uniref:alpha/beta hydrolase n=2 Tax=Myxococcus qinghaiensis TaxID=2906758 RepID=UPI0020A816F2|nr:alpha/beta fold hydrolase [Myxococcus qinghaiensis]MCP3163244.1 lysophospholipase [Myxococcus qinghaiensis]
MAKNSTNVRAKLSMWGVKAAALSVGAVAPGLTAAWADRMFRTPRRPHRSKTAEAVLARGQPRMLTLGGEEVAVWSWGVGPRVLLVHGWSGYGGQLTAFVEPLVAAGFSVVTYDAPGHGQSSGRTSSLPEMAELVADVARATGGPYAVIAHSLGAAATAVAMRDGLKVGRAVFVSPPADPRSGIQAFARAMGLTDGVWMRMEQRIEARFSMRLRDLALPHFVPLLGRVPLHVFHDVGDREVPLVAGEAVASAWPGARLTRTQGLGHHRILYAPEVVSQAVDFLAEGKPETAWADVGLLASASASASAHTASRSPLRLVRHS